MYARLRLPGTDAPAVASLLGSVDGTFQLKGTPTHLQIDKLELTFSAAGVSTEAYTESSPEIHLELPVLTFPLP